MAWVRFGDDAASNGTVLAVLEDEEADDRSPEEVLGYVMLLASVSAAHWQDYAVSMGQAIQLARSRARAERLLGMAQRAGYGELQRDSDTGRLRFLLHDDPSFIHMITKDEKDWAAQQKADNSNPVLTVQVRRRDGDACRYCAVVVNYQDRKGGRGGTYDHRPPGRRAASPSHLVVACRTCNGTRGEASQGLDPEEGLVAADAVLPLLPVPRVPYFKTATVSWLEENRSVLIQFGLTVPPRPAKDLRPGTQAPGTELAPDHGVRSDTQQASAASAPDTVCDPQQGRWAPVAAAGSTGSTPPSGSAPGAPQTAPGRGKQIRQIDGLHDPDSPGRDGTGRSGSVRDVTGRAGPGRDESRPRAGSPPGTKSRRRRGRRGGRGR